MDHFNFVVFMIDSDYSYRRCFSGEVEEGSIK